MRNIWTIAKREYDHYFISPIAYIFAVAMLFIMGLYFAYMMLAANQQASQGFGFIPEITELNGLFSFLLLFATPALTMRLLADETRTGTIELLLTAPVRDFELVVGKWLGSMLFMLTLIAVMVVFPFILNSQVDPGIDQKILISSYLGLILLAGAYLAIGVAISAIFSNQVSAFFVTFAIFISLWWLVGIPGGLLPVGGEFFQYMVINSHYSSTLNAGSVNLSDLVYFFSLIALGLFTGTVAIEIRRWK